MQPLSEPTSREELLAQMRDEYNAFVALVEQVPPERRATPISGMLSVKDIVAHITFWEADMLRRLRAAALGEVPPEATDAFGEPAAGAGPYDAVNADAWERFKDADWETVWDDLVRTHEECLAEVEQMSEADLFDPARARQVTGRPDRVVVRLITGETSGHLREHADELRAVLGQ